MSPTPRSTSWLPDHLAVAAAPSRRAGATTVLRTVVWIESGSPAWSAVGTCRRVTAASVGMGGERHRVDGDVAPARRRGERRRFAAGLAPVGEEDDAAAARSPRQRQPERRFEVRFAAGRGCRPGCSASGPTAAPVTSAPPPNWTTWQSVAAAVVRSPAIRRSASPEAGPTLSERSRTSVVGGGDEPAGRVEEGDRDEHDRGRLQADRDPPPARPAAVGFPPPGVDRLDDQDDQRRDQHPLPPVGVPGAFGRGGRREVDRGAGGGRRAGVDRERQVARPPRPAEFDRVVAGPRHADRDFGARGDVEVFRSAAGDRGKRSPRSCRAARRA